MITARDGPDRSASRTGGAGKSARQADPPGGAGKSARQADPPGGPGSSLARMYLVRLEDGVLLFLCSQLFQ
ncbi:hypothetical protein N803_10560 [Knoellia subterranea KCTC 19937]|uniref:Uncharacterized protein n=1 Tax=Knoellia subterranea KCTC 19937 TaxID=1385521 RepID=A0A0A0JMG6_9MICO|nr:hypothetical protein N803_10560 [Knoellia subterranea KCTC 19937]